MLVSQALSSASNFALFAAAARVASLDELAALSVATLAFGFATGIVRSAIFRRALVEGASAEVGPALSATKVVAAATAAGLALTAAAWPGSRPILLPFALGSLLLLPHDAARQTLLIRRQFPQLLGLDALWLGLICVGLAVAPESIGPYVWIWIASGALSLTIVSATSEPARRALMAKASGGVAQLRSLGAELAEVAVLRGVPFVGTIAVALIVLTDDFGAWSGLRGFFGPLTVLYAAVAGGGLTLAAPLLRRDPKRALAFSAILFAAPPVGALLLTLALNQVVFGSRFGPSAEVVSGFEPFVAPVALFVAFAGVVQVCRMMTLAAEASRSLVLKTQVAASTVGTGTLVLGSTVDMTTGAWAAGFGAGVGALIWGAAFWRSYAARLET